jgi:hypothetical protein
LEFVPADADADADAVPVGDAERLVWVLGWDPDDFLDASGCAS